MKTVILCGGLGTRLAEETQIRPKPMVEIGMKPILWHIMKIYEASGFNDFLLALGYKGEMIKDYFLHYHPRASDITVNLRSGEASYMNADVENWTVQMVDTGRDSLTGGRLNRLRSYLIDSGTFMLTYGDGVGDIPVDRVLEFHRRHGKIATVTAVRPPARFGTMRLDGDEVLDFKEKPQAGEGWVNGGYFVFEAGVFDYLVNDSTVLEAEPLEGLARDGQLMAFRHEGFWHPMDTIRDRNYLDEHWQSGNAAWKVWSD